MQPIEFSPLGKRTSRIGLGCARLVGRSSLRRSAQLVETALRLGIRYFDVAPSYGMGTAEEVLGEVLGNATDVTIATKVGVPRPVYSARANLVRTMAKVVLDRVPSLKRKALDALPRPREERPRYDFSAGAIRASLEVSLGKLRRSSVDVFLAHEPHVLDLTPEVTAGFEALRSAGLISAFGAGVGEASDRWASFGSIWQSRWPGDPAKRYAHDVHYIWHGAVRSGPSNAEGADPSAASAIVRRVLSESPGSILLVSASTPQRLEQLVGSLAEQPL